MEGANKLLLPYKGQALIKTVSQNLISSRLDPVFIITGFDYKKIHKNIPSAINNIIYNKDWSSGISKSIILAISSLPDNIDGNMFVLGDMPLITVKTLNKLKSAFKMNNGEKIIYAEYFGSQANPVIFPKKYFRKILLLKGDRGCRRCLGVDGVQARSQGRTGAEDQGSALCLPWGDRQVHRPPPCSLR